MRPGGAGKFPPNSPKFPYCRPGGVWGIPQNPPYIPLLGIPQNSPKLPCPSARCTRGTPQNSPKFPYCRPRGARGTPLNSPEFPLLSARLGRGIPDGWMGIERKQKGSLYKGGFGECTFVPGLGVKEDQKS